MMCAVCDLPMNEQLVRLGETTHPACDRFDYAAQYCRPGCPDGDCCLKAKTFRPIRNVPTGERL